MPDPAPTAKAAFNETIMGMPLWEQVKLSIFFYWTDANEKLTEIDRIRMTDHRLTEVELGWRSEDFKAAVLRLYRSCRSKIDYHKTRPSIDALIRLNMDRFLFEPAKFDLETAMTAFVYLTDFLEYDGITYFEEKKIDSEHIAIGELE